MSYNPSEKPARARLRASGITRSASAKARAIQQGRDAGRRVGATEISSSMNRRAASADKFKLQNRHLTESIDTIKKRARVWKKQVDEKEELLKREQALTTELQERLKKRIEVDQQKEKQLAEFNKSFADLRSEYESNIKHLERAQSEMKALQKEYESVQGSARSQATDDQKTKEELVEFQKNLKERITLLSASESSLKVELETQAKTLESQGEKIQALTKDLAASEKARDEAVKQYQAALKNLESANIEVMSLRKQLLSETREKLGAKEQAKALEGELVRYKNAFAEQKAAHEQMLSDMQVTHDELDRSVSKDREAIRANNLELKRLQEYIKERDSFLWKQEEHITKQAEAIQKLEERDAHLHERSLALTQHLKAEKERTEHLEAEIKALKVLSQQLKSDRDQAERALAGLRELETDPNDIRTFSEGEEDHYIARIIELQKKLDELALTVDALTKEKEHFRSNLQASTETLSLREKELSELQVEIREEAQKNEQLQRKLKESSDALNLQASAINPLKEENRQLKYAIRVAEGEKRALQDKIAKLDAKIKEQNARITEQTALHEASLHDIAKRIGHVRAEKIDKYEKDQSESKETLEQLKKDRDNSQAQLIEKNRHIQALSDENATLKRRIKELELNVGVITEERNQASEKIKTLMLELEIAGNELRERKTREETLNNKIADEHRQTEQQMSALKAKLAGVELDAQQNAVERDAAQAKIKKLEEDLGAAKLIAYSEIQMAKKAYEERERELQAQLEQGQRATTVALEQVRSELKDKSEQIGKIQKEKEAELASSKEDFRKLQAELEEAKARAKNAQEQLVAEQGRSQQEREKVETKHKQYEEAQAKLAEKERELEAARLQIQKQKDELESLRASVAGSDQRELGDREQLQARFDKISEEQERLKKQLELHGPLQEVETPKERRVEQTESAPRTELPQDPHAAVERKQVVDRVQGEAGAALASVEEPRTESRATQEKAEASVKQAPVDRESGSARQAPPPYIGPPSTSDSLRLTGTLPSMGRSSTAGSIARPRIAIPSDRTLFFKHGIAQQIEKGGPTLVVPMGTTVTPDVFKEINTALSKGIQEIQRTQSVEDTDSFKDWMVDEIRGDTFTVCRQSCDAEGKSHQDALISVVRWGQNIEIDSKQADQQDDVCYAMVLAAKIACDAKGRKRFTIENCEQDPKTALKLYLIGVSSGLQPTFKDAPMQAGATLRGIIEGSFSQQTLIVQPEGERTMREIYEDVRDGKIEVTRLKAYIASLEHPDMPDSSTRLHR